jgi:hypothetical protein
VPALLILAPSAASSDRDTLAAMSLIGAALQASPIVVALPADVDAPPGSRVVRVKPDAAFVTAIRLGMAQLTNTTATAVLLWPHAAAAETVGSLRALIDAGAGEPGSIVAPAGRPLDAAPVLVPRDAWLELVTLGQDGLDALSTRRRIVRVEITSPDRSPARPPT